MRKFILSAATVILAGCSTLGPPVYSKPPGNTPQQFQADLAFCNAQAQPFNAPGGEKFMQQKTMCMAGKGYTQIGGIR